MSNTQRTNMSPFRRFTEFTSTLCLLLALSPLAYAGSLRDPTQPPKGSSVDPKIEAPLGTRTPLVLHAIFFAEGRRIAIINDQRLGINDVVQSARVVKIERGRVSLIRGGESIELQLVTHKVKKAIEAAETPSTASELTAAVAPTASPQILHPVSTSPTSASLDSVAPAAAYLDSLAPAREGNEP